MLNFRTLLASFCGVSMLLGAAASNAQLYPNKPIRIVVGQAAGGGMDTLARVVSVKLAASLGQPVIVENKAGAAGVIGTQFVAKAPADGYTLLLAPIGNMVFVPLMNPQTPYSPTKDFAPVSMVANFPLLLVVNARQPIKTVQELAAAMKADPGKSNYGGSGPAFQFASELFRLQTKTPGEFIQYKSMSETIGALISGDLLMSMVDTGPATGAIADGRLRALAVTSPKRLPSMPQVPTMAEVGMPALEFRYWAGIFAPAGTPPDIVSRLGNEINAALKQPDVMAQMAAIQVDPAGSTPAELGRTLEADLLRWGEVSRNSNIKQ